MQTVRIADNTVAEVIPAYALPVDYWYGEDFAARCVEAPDEVEQRWTYEPESGEFFPPVESLPTPAQMRETAYDSEPIIEWDGALLTVTAAAQKWQYYAAEGSPKADALQSLIAEAKETIRAKYPDEVGV